MIKRIISSRKTYILPASFLFVHVMILLIRYFYCFCWIERNIISNNGLYIIFATLFPFIAWICSTMCENFNYERIKKTVLILCILNAELTVFQALWAAIYDHAVIPILNIQPTETLTKTMILNLARLLQLFALLLCGFIVSYPLLQLLTDKLFNEELGRFKLDHFIDLRKNRHSAYDIPILKDIQGTGKVMPLYEDDMLTHLLLLGPSGTGKTSSSIIPMVIALLEKKETNRVKREELLIKLLNEGKGHLNGPVLYPTEYDIVIDNTYQSERDAIYKKYPDCGITCVSPNESIGDDIVSLCGQCNIRVNMIDPTKIYLEENVDRIGMNPFFVPFDISEEERAILIINQAKIFSETLITVNESSADSSGEQYFRDLNTSVTSNIAIICMLYANLTHRQTSIGEIQDCINNFKLLYPKCQLINEVMNFKIRLTNPDALESEKKRSTRGASIDLDTAGLSQKLRGNTTTDNANSPALSNHTAEKNSNKTDEPAADQDGNRAYRFAVEYYNNELINHGERMYDQSRGLRNLINDMLSEPRAYKVLNSIDHFINYDQALSRCEITVINTAIRISQQVSTAIGLFFLLNHKRAVLRRPQNDRQPHFLIIDEATQYVHPWMEDAIGLYRQYKCSCTFAFQSLAQLNKTNKTRYIQGLLLTVGNMIIYGRVGIDEMRIFEQMGGSRKIVEIQKSINKTSPFIDNPSESEGERHLETDNNIASGSDIRIRNFQEVYWIGSVNGNVQFARLAKVSFADKNVFRKKSFKHSDFTKYTAKIKPPDNRTADYPASVAPCCNLISENTDAAPVIAQKGSIFENESLEALILKETNHNTNSNISDIKDQEEPHEFYFI